MKNCIVFSGQYRSFDQTKDNLKKFIEINDLDVYCHLWSTNYDEIGEVEKYLQPKALLCEDWMKYKDTFDGIERRVRESNPKNAPNDKVAGNASMNFGRKKAFDLIEQQYGNLIYCRYDIAFDYLFTFNIPDQIITPIEESYNLISDIFAIMPFHLAKNYFIYDQYERLHSTQFEEVFEDFLRHKKQYGDENIRIHKYERYCPHMMLLRNLIMTNTQFTITSLPVRIRR